MAVRRPLPDEHHVLRYVSASKRFVDENGLRLGPSGAGFKLRPDDRGGLSVTEIEHYGEMNRGSICLAAAAYRQSQISRSLGAQAIFAWAKISDAKAASESYGKSIRVVHDPVPGNPGHAEVRHFDDDDFDLLDYFATDVFKDYEVVINLGLPPADS